MDRPILYAGALPLETDGLALARDAMTAIGKALQATLGTSTVLDGFTCIPTAPESMNVQITAGAICELGVVDTTAYSSLATDSMPLVKMGYSRETDAMTITAPSTLGYAQSYLVQIAFDEEDDTPVLLPFYNADDPTEPLQGPGNSNDESLTRRVQLAVVNLKAGTAAPAGTQSTPSPSIGYTPAFVVTVAHGQNTITSADISRHPDAPFIDYKLPAIPLLVQQQPANYAIDTGTANAMAVATLPSYTVLVPGLSLRIKKSALSNTNTVTIAVNAGTAVTVTWADGTALVAGDWPGGAIGEVVYTGTVWQLIGVAGPSVFSRVAPEAGPSISDQSLVHYGVDAGTANAVSISSVSPALTGAVAAGTLFEVVKIASANTDAMTATISGQAGTVIWADGTALVAGDWPASGAALLMFDGSHYRILSFAGPSVFPRASTVGAGLVELASPAEVMAGTDTERAVTPADLERRIPSRAYGTYDLHDEISGVIPLDDTVPQVGEGTEIISVTITPKRATSRIRLTFHGQAYGDDFHGIPPSLNQTAIAALFKSGNASALAATFTSVVESLITPFANHLHIVHEDTPTTTSPITYSVRVGANTGTIRFNGTHGYYNSPSRMFGGASKATLVAEEIFV